uniref:Uncharacterized protein n=1 Tax=Arundo donax TaxID=35708 RepID=A0A0A9BVV9_ARUDO
MNVRYHFWNWVSTVNLLSGKSMYLWCPVMYLYVWF